jgi:hypothetical protein
VFFISLLVYVLFILDDGGGGGGGGRNDLQVLECICNYAEQILGKTQRGGTRGLGPGIWLTISQHKGRYLIERYPGHGIWMEERKVILVLNLHFIWYSVPPIEFSKAYYSISKELS